MNSLLIKIRNLLPSKSIKRTISQLKKRRKPSVKVNPISRREIHSFKSSFHDKNERYSHDLSLFPTYQIGSYLYSKQRLNRREIEKTYDYLTEDEDLDHEFDKCNDTLDIVERRRFIDLNDKELYYHFSREDLYRRGSGYLIHLAFEIVQRYTYQISLENVKKSEKKIYFNSGKKETAYQQKLKHDITKLDEKTHDQIEEVYINPDTRIKLKEKFFFYESFWKALMNIDDSKIKGKLLIYFVNIISKTFSQRLEVWEKFVRCFALNLREFNDKSIQYKPLQYNEVLKIIKELYWANSVCEGINIPCHLMKDLLLQYKDLFVKIINASKDFDTFEILPFYRYFTNEFCNELEVAVRNKLEIVGSDIDFYELPELLSFYSEYYEDSNSPEFSIIENLFIKATILQKQENQRKIQYARKILKLDQKVENADMNNAMINYKTFEPELYVLKNFAVTNLWFPYKYMNSFIQNFLELDYYKNMQLVVEMSQLLAKFSYYDPDHHNKLMNALHSLSFPETHLNLLFDIFILSITNSKINNQILESSYENLVNFLKPHFIPDTPAQFKKPLDFEEIATVYEKILNYYNNVLHLKKNSHFRDNEKKFGEVAKMSVEVFRKLSEDREKNLNNKKISV